MIKELNDLQKLFLTAWSKYHRGDFQRAKTDFETALAQARIINHRPSEARALLELGQMAEIVDHDLQKARTLHEAALAIYSNLGSARRRAYALTSLSRVFLAGGDVEQAKRCLDEAMDIFRQRQDNQGLASALHELFRVRLVEKELELAEQHLRESLRLYEELERKSGIARVLLSLGGICLAFHHDPQQARTHFHRALELFEELGYTFEAGQVRHNLEATDAVEPYLTNHSH